MAYASYLHSYFHLLFVLGLNDTNSNFDPIICIKMINYQYPNDLTYLFLTLEVEESSGGNSSSNNEEDHGRRSVVITNRLAVLVRSLDSVSLSDNVLAGVNLTDIEVVKDAVSVLRVSNVLGLVYNSTVVLFVSPCHATDRMGNTLEV